MPQKERSIFRFFTLLNSAYGFKVGIVLNTVFAIAVVVNTGKAKKMIRTTKLMKVEGHGNELLL